MQRAPVGLNKFVHACYLYFAPKMNAFLPDFCRKSFILLSFADMCALEVIAQRYGGNERLESAFQQLARR